MRVLDPMTDMINGTSYHGVTIEASYTQLSLAFGDALRTRRPSNDREFIGDDKVSYEWRCLTEDERPFTIYDWKEGKFSDQKVIEWHIGSHDLYSSLVAKDEVVEELMARLSDHFPNDQTFGQEIRKTIHK
jgi:hypothetical protein